MLILNPEYTTKFLIRVQQPSIALFKNMFMKVWNKIVMDEFS